MIDREKVISTLEEIKTQTAEIGLDSAVIAHKFIDKIIALLKEQEHKDKMFHALADDWKRLNELLKEQEAKWIHREDMDFIDKYNCTHFHGMCTNCGLAHDFIDGHTGQYLYCPQCGRAVKWE